MKTTRQIYCQYLLSTQTNYTCTYLSEHFEGLDENSIYRYLSNENLTPKLVWEKAKTVIQYFFLSYFVIILLSTVLKSLSCFCVRLSRDFCGFNYSTDNLVIRYVRFNFLNKTVSPCELKDSLEVYRAIEEILSKVKIILF